ncbi:MAG: hypothetical protein ACRBBN_10750 [Methyloligellaceae bacterium]
MKHWKLATVLLVVSFIATLVCISAAAQVWNYVYPRAIFINSACFFGLSSLFLFLTILFLDDLSVWIGKRKSVWYKTILSLSFSLVFTAMMVVALYTGAVGSYTLSRLSVCGFNKLESICTKTVSELSEQELVSMKYDFYYHLSFENNPDISSVLLAIGFKKPEG